MKYTVLLAFLSAVKFVFFKIYNMLILYFHIFQRGFEVLNAILQTYVYATILTPLCVTICTTVSKVFNILKEMEFLIKSFFII